MSGLEIYNASVCTLTCYNEKRKSNSYGSLSRTQSIIISISSGCELMHSGIVEIAGEGGVDASRNRTALRSAQRMFFSSRGEAKFSQWIQSMIDDRNRE